MNDEKYSLKDFHFELPDELIAQYPLEKRDSSRLFILNRNTGEYEHRYFYEISDYIKEGDLLVINDVRVFNARMFFYRETGAKVEVILTQKFDANKFLVLTNRTKRIKIHETLTSIKDNAVHITVLDRLGDYLLVSSNTELDEKILADIGEIPLPPYIKRQPENNDNIRYQTVYSNKNGAAAAPTAGLHFTEELMSKIKNIGASFASLTLNVSWGTFQPVRTQNISEHSMHREDFELSENAAHEINKARNEKRRIIAVGTTAVRVLETTYKNGINQPAKDATDIFIYPPQRIKSVDALITNFHTPESTLLMLVSAFAGYETIMNAYRKAVEMKYRFFSYGDAMFII